MQERLNRWLAGLHPLFRRVLVFVIGMTLLFVGIVRPNLPGRIHFCSEPSIMRLARPIS